MANILIAVSSDIIATALETSLAQHDIHSCRTGTDALALLEAVRPDIFILELTLPDTSGLSVLQATRYKPPVILALTPLLTDAVQQATEDAGVQALLLLPCTVGSILRHLEALTENPTPVA